MTSKKVFILFLSLCLTALFVSMAFLTGCSGATTTTPAAPTTSAAPATSAAPTTSAPPTTSAAPASTPAAAATIKLKFYTNFPPSAGPSQEGQLLADAVSKASNGKVAITVYPAEQLGPNSAVLDLLKNGITDMAALGLPPFATLFPLENGQELAMAVLPDWVTAFNVRNQLSLGDYGQAFAKNNLHFINWNIVRPMQFFLNKKVVKAEDFKGMKVRSPNPAIVQPFTQFGVVTVTMGLGDVYESLQRGVIDGVINSPENAVANKWYEVCKFAINQNLSYGGTVMVMSQSAWDALPKDAQAAINQAIPQWQTQAIAFYKDMESKAFDTMKANKVEIYALDATESARWTQLATPVVDAWVTKTDAPGVPAKAMVDAIRKAATTK